MTLTRPASIWARKNASYTVTMRVMSYWPAIDVPEASLPGALAGEIRVGECISFMASDWRVSGKVRHASSRAPTWLLL